VYLYSALFVVPHTQGAQAWITQCYLQLHQCLTLPRKRVHSVLMITITALPFCCYSSKL